MSSFGSLPAFPKRIAGAYAVAALLWIGVSDLLLGILAGTLRPALFAAGKGALFVLVTSLVLYTLLSRVRTKLLSAEQRLTHSRENYRHLFDSDPIPALIIDEATLTIRQANAAAHALYGYESAKLINQPMEILAQGASPPLPPDKASTPRAEDAIVRHRHRSGKTLYVLISATPTTFYDRSARLLRISDQTSWRKAGRERRKALRHMESAQRIGQLGFWELSQDHKRVFLSTGACRILDLDPQKGRTFSVRQLLRRVDKEDRRNLRADLTSIQPQKSFEFRYRFILTHGETRYVLLRGDKLVEDDGTRCWVGCGVDLTERYLAESRHLEQERRYATLVSILPEALLVCFEGVIAFANPAAATLFADDSIERLKDVSIKALCTDDQVCQRLAGTLAEDPRQVYRVSPIRMRSLSGGTFEAQLAARPLELEGRCGVQVLITDITERVQIKNALEQANRSLKQLASRTVSDLELERKNIAQALHDEIGQSLTAVSLSAGWLARRIHDAEAREKIRALTSIASETIEKVRDLSLMLRPPHLDELGLIAALEWQAARLLDPAGVTWQIEGPRPLPPLDPNIEIIAFRVVQESLTNIVRHAQASQARIWIAACGPLLQIEILDDGVGIALPQPPRGLGLQYMTERVRLVGGELSVRGDPATGTRVRAQLPLELITKVEHDTNRTG